MAGTVRYEVEGDIAVLTIDHAPVNSIGADVRSGLAAAVERAEAAADVRAVAIVGARGIFSAGADINEFGAAVPRQVLPHLQIVDACSKPVAAGIAGLALGGGLELAMACGWRIAVSDARLALPEVKIGIIPGGGGTQRLPRLIGLEKALDMICTGEAVVACNAAAGLIDRIVDGDIRAATIAFLREKLAADETPVPARDRAAHLSMAHAAPDMFEAARARYRQLRRGVDSPQRCIDAVEISTTKPFEEGLILEREMFLALVGSPQAAALRHAFFAERAARKIPGVPADAPTREIGTAAVVGAGTMGGGIAMSFANAGIPVTLTDASREALDKRLETIRRTYESSVARGRISTSQAETRMGLIRPSQTMRDIADADFVVESVFEAMEVKRAVFQELDRIAKPGAILASNTSSLDINALARQTARPGDVIGFHFFSPANVMKLVEVVRGEDTAVEVIATSLKLAQRLDKIPVTVGVCDGFVGNRMLAAYRRQSRLLIVEGAAPEQVDEVLHAFGFAMGPFAASDLAGLDVAWRIRRGKGQEEPVDDRLCELGRFGQKTGAGYYLYGADGRTPHPDPDVAAIIESVSRDIGLSRRAIPDDEILNRCLMALVNEGARILEEGIALRASDIDVIQIHGYGFPRHRGGPMHWADRTGLPKVLADIRRYQSLHPGSPLWEPAPLLVRLVAEERSFSDYDKASDRSRTA